VTWARVIWTIALWSALAIGGMYCAARLVDWLATS
jgi:hypothetical protein